MRFSLSGVRVLCFHRARLIHTHTPHIVTKHAGPSARASTGATGVVAEAARRAVGWAPSPLSPRPARAWRGPPPRFVVAFLVIYECPLDHPIHHTHQNRSAASPRSLLRPRLPPSPPRPPPMPTPPTAFYPAPRSPPPHSPLTRPSPSGAALGARRPRMLACKGKERGRATTAMRLWTR